METRQYLIRKQLVQCLSCKTSFEGITEAPDEGFGYAAHLYECRGCGSILCQSEETRLYARPLGDRLTSVKCPGCGGALGELIEALDFVGKCPECGKRNYVGTDIARDDYILAYDLDTIR